MAQPLPGSDPIPPDDPPVDDLTAIRGIGPNRCKSLQRSLHILTFADLAAASVDTIADHLKNQSHTVSRQDIAGWIAQAAEIVAASPAAATDHTMDDVTAGPPADGASNDASDGGADDTHGGAEDPEAWRSLATFSLDMQVQTTGEPRLWRTVVHHAATQTTQTFTGVDLLEFRQWLQAHLATLPLPEPAPPPAPHPVPAANLVQMQVTQMSARVMVVEPRGNMVLGPWQGDRPFEVTVTFQGSELLPELAIAASTATYALQVLAWNRTTRQSALLAEVSDQPLTSPETTCHLPNLILGPGLYRLEVHVHLQGSLPGCFKFPLCPVLG